MTSTDTTRPFKLHARHPAYRRASSGGHRVGAVNARTVRETDADEYGLVISSTDMVSGATTYTFSFSAD